MSVTTTYRGLDKLQPEFKKQVENWMKETVTLDGKRQLVNEVVFITETFRSAERQKYLFNKGLSYIDGYKKIGKHQQGLAVDIAFHGSYLYPSDMEPWRVVADAAKKHGIDWGQDLWGWDKPHFQDAKGSYDPPPPEYGLDEWQRNAVRWAKKEKVSNGERPLDPITRVEVMEMLRKFSQR